MFNQSRYTRSSSNAELKTGIDLDTTKITKIATPIPPYHDFYADRQVKVTHSEDGTGTSVGRRAYISTTMGPLLFRMGEDFNIESVEGGTNMEKAD